MTLWSQEIVPFQWCCWWLREWWVLDLARRAVQRSTLHQINRSHFDSKAVWTILIKCVLAQIGLIFVNNSKLTDFEGWKFWHWNRKCFNFQFLQFSWIAHNKHLQQNWSQIHIDLKSTTLHKLHNQNYDIQQIHKILHAYF